MIKKKIFSLFAITSILVGLLSPPVTAASTPNYTISGTTATAKDGVYEIPHYSGFGTVSVDLKKGTLAFDSVYASNSKPFLSILSGGDVSYDIGSNAISSLKDTGFTLSGSQYYSSRGCEFVYGMTPNTPPSLSSSFGIPIAKFYLNNTSMGPMTESTMKSYNTGAYAAFGTMVRHTTVTGFDSKRTYYFSIENSSVGWGKATASYSTSTASGVITRLDNSGLGLQGRAPVLLKSTTKSYSYAVMAPIAQTLNFNYTGNNYSGALLTDMTPTAPRYVAGSTQLNYNIGSVMCYDKTIAANITTSAPISFYGVCYQQNGTVTLWVAQASRYHRRSPAKYTSQHQ